MNKGTGRRMTKCFICKKATDDTIHPHFHIGDEIIGSVTGHLKMQEM